MTSANPVDARASFSTITVECVDGMASVVLNRPQVRNAFNATMIADVTRAFEDLGQRDEVRAIVLQGAGAMFCAGADVEWMRGALEYGREENVADALRMSRMFDAIDLAPQPTIAAVQGAALGGGMGLLAACDVVIATDDARFGFTETKLGIVPAVISGVVLPRIGSGWARALYLTGERFSADMARQIGLVHWIVPASELAATVQTKLTELRSSGPRATRVAKRLIQESAPLDADSVRTYLATTIAEVRTSQEGQEGLRAFLEKRAPTWRA